MKKIYKCAAEYQLKIANYGSEYYFILFPFKYILVNNNEIREELEYLTEKNLVYTSS
jgi:hypothetical protein